jgi:hypothetical protein
MTTPNGTVQRRARAQLSCVSCRTGKLKCDRGHPCDQCVKRTKDSQCTYQAAPKKKPRRPTSTKERISQLETLVVQLMNQEPGRPATSSGSRQEPVQELTPESGPANSSPEQDSSPERDDSDEDDALDAGQIRMSNGEANYIGGAHWESILSQVN